MHVADASVSEDELHEMLAAVDEVLAETEAPESARASSRSTRSTCWTTSVAASSPSASRSRFQVSATDGAGLADLREAIEARFLTSLRPMELLVPYAEGTSLSELHDVAGELEREDTAEGVRIRARVPVAVASRFERFQSSSGSLAQP